MLVSSKNSSGISGAAFLFGVLFFEDATLSAGDSRPVEVSVGVAVWALLGPGRPTFGRMVGTLRVWPAPRADGAAITMCGMVNAE